LFSRIRQVAAMCPLLTAHWCHLANAVKLVHSSARLSAQPKWQMDQFSCFCTAHGRSACAEQWASLSTRMAPSHGPPSVKAQWARRLVQPFLHSWLQNVPILYDDSPISPQHCPFPWGILDTMVPFVLNPNGNSVA